MKRALIPLLALLAAAPAFAATVTEQQIAKEVLNAVRLHPGMPNPNSLQLYQVIVTEQGVCMEYQVLTNSGGVRTGYAVYKLDRDLVYIDNEWIWNSSCLTGKYGQRREGRDVTKSVSAALEVKKKEPQPVSVARTQPRKPFVPVLVAPAPEPAPQPAAVAPTVAASVPAQSLANPAPAAKAAPVQPSSAAMAAPKAVANVAPVASAPAQVVPAPAPVTETASISTAPIVIVPPPVVIVAPPPAPASAASRPGAAAAPAESAAATVAPASLIAREASTLPPAAPPVNVPPAPPTVVAPPALQTIVAPAPALVTPEVSTVRGVTIQDDNGVLGRPTPTAPGVVVQESLADAARRIRKSKQQ